MADDNRHVFAGKRTADGEEAAGRTHTVLREVVDVRDQLCIPDCKEFRVIYQGTVDATVVRAFNMHVLIVACSQFGLGCKVAHDMVVLHFGQTDQCTAHIRKDISPHLGQHRRHVVQLVRVLHLVPMITSLRCEIIVVLSLVMHAVEQILLVVEPDGID